MARIIAAFAVLQLCAAQDAPATVNVLACSAGTRFADTQAPLAITEYSGLLSSILGLSSPTQYNWNGLLPAGLFNRPRTVASIIVEGPAIDMSAQASHSYTMSYSAPQRHSLDAIRAINGVHEYSTTAAVPALVSSVFGTRATVVSVSADAEVARLTAVAGSTDASVHTVTAGAHGAYTDAATNANAFAMPTEVDWSNFAGVTFDGIVAMVGDVEFGSADLELFSELSTMHAVAAMLKNHADSHPSVLTFTITKYAEIVARHGADTPIARAARTIVVSSVAAIAQQLSVAYGEKAVVLGLTLGGKISRDAPTAESVVQERARRGPVFSQSNVSSLNLGVPLAQYSQFPEYFTVDNCARYRCTCFAIYTAFQATELYKSTCGTNCYNFSAYNNLSFSTTSSADTSAGCINLDSPGDTTGRLCAWQQAACDCSNEAFFEEIDGLTGMNYLYPGKFISGSANFNNTNASIGTAGALRSASIRNPNRRMSTDPTCVVCAYGFTLSNGICYQDNAETKAMQAALWIGLASTAGLIGMWYVLHSITDGGKWSYLGDVPDIPDAKKGQ